MPSFLRYALVATGGLLATVVVGLAAVIAFDSPAAPPRLAAGDTLPGFSSWNLAEIPEVRRVAARDGAPLTYRLYPGRKDRAVVLVHGSSGAGFAMHKSAQALQAAGATVYAVSLRGHGGSGTVNGDTSYLGQLDDDLADLVKAVGLAGPAIHKTLIGFSAGGSFVLRTASGRQHELFDAYLAISPFVASDSPTSKPDGGGWVGVAVPRLIALSLLDEAGLPLLQGLPVMHFATQAKASDARTPVYSYRLLIGMQLSRDWRQEIARISRPTAVIVGGNDELFHAEEFQPLFRALNPRIVVAVQPGFGHMDMSTDPRACEAVAALWRRLVDSSRFDFKAREDFFAGLDGDKEAFDRAMKLIAETLAGHPDHAEALVWRGDGQLFLAGQAFQKGDIAQGRTLSAQGISDMMRAVSLAPDCVGVRVPRATGLLPFARGLRAYDRVEADRLTTLAMEDLEFVATGTSWANLAAHNRGELLGALAEGWLQLGDTAKAGGYLDRMIKELPGTPYALNASARRTDPRAKAPLTCLGCH